MERTLGFNPEGELELRLTVTLEDCRDYLQEVHDYEQQGPPERGTHLISDAELTTVLLEAQRDLLVDTYEAFRDRIKETLGADFP